MSSIKSAAADQRDNPGVDLTRRPTFNHYIVSEARPGRLSTLCGFEVYATPTPAANAPRCSDCEQRLSMLEQATSYSRRYAIEPWQAAQALNMPSSVVMALR